jgi:cytochrome c biogenesis protein CcmG/thiol:disulfide interchange protein DsbE
MKRSLLPLGLFALIVVVLAVGIYNAPKNGSKLIVSPLLGRSAPSFTLPKLIDVGQQFESRSMQGRWHLVNVWGTWCVECRAEHATLLKIKEQGSVPIIGIDWKDDDAAAVAWLAQLGNPYDMVVADREGRVAIDWGVYAAPESFLVNPQGIVVEKQTGAMNLEDWQAKFLPHLSKAPSPTGKSGA